ncbi:hypothetical protein HKD37_05G013240 [Glycine soja]
MELIENMTASDHAILRDRTHVPTKRSLLELSSQDALLAHNKLLAKQLESLTKTLSKLPTQLRATQPSHLVVLQVRGCSIYGEAHDSGCCIPLDDTAKEVNYIGNQHRPRFNTGGFSCYHQGAHFNQNQRQWRSHPGNQFNKEQGGPSNRPQNQRPSLYVVRALISPIMLSEPYDKTRFISKGAWERYEQNVHSRNILLERNVNLFIMEYDEFHRELERRQWHKALTRQPDSHIDVALIKEFYANLYDPKEKSPRQVRVRGRLIKFDGETLNAFLETLVVLEPGERYTTYTRARLVYVLVTRMDMDVGSFILGQISQMAQSNSSWLGFPALITTLCIARGVISDSLTFEPLSPAINLAYIRKNCWNSDDPTITFLGTRKTRVRGSDASTLSSSAPAPLAPPVPAPSGPSA